MIRSNQNSNVSNPLNLMQLQVANQCCQATKLPEKIKIFLNCAVHKTVMQTPDYHAWEGILYCCPCTLENDGRIWKKAKENKDAFTDRLELETKLILVNMTWQDFLLLISGLILDLPIFIHPNALRPAKTANLSAIGSGSYIKTSQIHLGITFALTIIMKALRG